MTELEEKTARIVGLLDENDLDAVILNAQHNFAWITCGGSNGVDLSRENGAASVIVTRGGSRFLLANVIEIDRMLAEEISEDEFDPIEFDWRGERADPASILSKARSVLGTGAAIATDLAMFSDAPSIEGRIAPLRYELTPGEIERYRDLGRDAANAIQRVIGSVEPGRTEIEIAAEMRKQLANSNIQSVVTLVAADERIEKFRHPVPTEKRLDRTLLLVTCAKRSGLIASLSRMVCVGAPSDEVLQRTEAAALVNASLWHATRRGTTGAELYRTAANAYSDAGFPDEINKHHQGGATGYRTREWVAHPKSSEAVGRCQAFAWNPSITGTKVEETVIATDGVVEVITKSPDFPVIATEIAGCEYLSPGILSIEKRGEDE